MMQWARRRRRRRWCWGVGVIFYLNFSNEKNVNIKNLCQCQHTYTYTLHMPWPIPLGIPYHTYCLLLLTFLYLLHIWWLDDFIPPASSEIWKYKSRIEVEGGGCFVAWLRLGPGFTSCGFPSLLHAWPLFLYQSLALVISWVGRLSEDRADPSFSSHGSFVRTYVRTRKYKCLGWY